MRTYVQLKLRQVEPPTPDESIRRWLELSRFRPQRVSIPDDVRELLFQQDDIPREMRLAGHDTAKDHATDILLAIPRFSFERAHALETAKYVIHLDDTANNATVWGLVCVDETTVTVRWRHFSTKSLEYATQQLIDVVWANAGPDKLFHEFESGHRIPVREPLSTNDAYSGTVLGPRSARVARARAEKRSELRIAVGSLCVFAVCTIVGGYLFMHSQVQDFTRWLSGAVDRLATTALATSAVSYLTYLFRRGELVERPSINWE